MILEFTDHHYVHVDKIQGLRWIEQDGGQDFGVIILDGSKMTVQDRELFDVIENAFIYLHKSYIYDEKLKKISYVKRGKE